MKNIFEKIESIISEGAFGTFEYEIPSDKRQLMLDFYLLSTMSEDSDNIDIDLSIKETKQKLMPYLKDELLKAVYFSTACEFRHCWDSSGTSKKDAYEIFKSKGVIKQVEQYVRLYAGWKWGKVKVREPEGTPKIARPRADDTYRDRFNSYRTCKTVWKNDADFLKVAKIGFYDLSWGGSFGGPNWGKIADGWLHLNSSTEIRDMSVWIDHVYALQHNTGTVFNKLKEYYDKKSGYDWLKDTLDYKFNLQEPMDFVDKVSPDLRKLYAAWNASFKVTGQRFDIGDTDVFGGPVGGQMTKRDVPSLDKWTEIKNNFQKGYGDKWNSSPSDLRYSASKYSWDKDTANIKIGDVVKLEKTKFIPEYSIIRHIGQLGTVGDNNSVWIDKVLFDKKGTQISYPSSPKIENIMAVPKETIIGISKAKEKAKEKVHKFDTVKKATINTTGANHSDSGDYATKLGATNFMPGYASDKGIEVGDVVNVISEFKSEGGNIVCLIQYPEDSPKANLQGTQHIFDKYGLSFEEGKTQPGKVDYAQHGMKMSDSFKVGDKVKYVGQDAKIKNWTGVIWSTVEGSHGDKVKVKWDNTGDSNGYTPFKYNLEKIGKEDTATSYTELYDLKVGDTVEYIGKKHKKSLGHGLHGKIVGKTSKLNFKVKWENNKRGSFYYKYLKKVDSGKITPPVTPKASDENKLKKGDKVKIVKKIQMFGDDIHWVDDMDATLGETATVLLTGYGDPPSHVTLKTSKGNYKYAFDSVEKVSETDTKFKVGDKVKYIGSQSPALEGDTGTITSVDNDQVFVDFETGGNKGVFAFNIEKIDTKPTPSSTDAKPKPSSAELNVGDKIEKNFSGGLFDKTIKGTVTEVVEDMAGGQGTAKVKWANDTETVIDLDGDYKILNKEEKALKVNDIVLVIKKSGNIWAGGMDSTVGKALTVTEFDADGSGTGVKLDNGYLYPPNTIIKFPFKNDLEKMDEEGKIEWFKDTDKALVGDVIKTSTGIYIVVKIDEQAGTRYWIPEQWTNDIEKLNKKSSENGVLVYTYIQSIQKVGKIK